MNNISDKANISPLVDIETSNRGNQVVIENNVTIDSFVKIKFAGGSGNVHIKEGAYINSGCVIYSGNGVSVGENVLIAANCTLAATNHQYSNTKITIKEQGFMKSKGGIMIAENCWIGAGCILLDGTILGQGCVIAAGTTLKGKWPPNSVIGGTPAKLIKTR